MDWQAPVDLYCERVGPGLFAEPLNAASNLSFLLAGLWLLFLLRHDQRVSLKILACMIVLIGLCSGAFHLAGQRWAEWLDVASIALFIHFFVVCFARHRLELGWSRAWLAAPAFMGFSWGVLQAVPADAMNGSMAYAPALAGLLILSTLLAVRGQAGAQWLALSAAIFCVSIALRSLDLAACPAWPLGTHWAWHLLNGAVLLLATLSLVGSGSKIRNQ